MDQELLAPDFDIRQRDRELTEIAKSIASLAELFKDLSVLVIDQGTLLDSIEYNIEQTAVQMSEAVKELEQLFCLDKATLLNVVGSFRHELVAGLADDRSSDLNMIPTYVTGRLFFSFFLKKKE